MLIVFRLTAQQTGNYNYDNRNRTQLAINTPIANAVLQQDNVMLLVEVKREKEFILLTAEGVMKTLKVGKEGS